MVRSSRRRAVVVLLCAVVCCLFVPGSSFGGIPSHPAPPIVGVPPSPNDPHCPTFDASTLPSALPPDPTPVAGSISGSFSVTPVGQATWSFPIAVPPGRLGLEPHLTVAYDSSGSDGYLGVGFSLPGLSAITRCPANMAQDGYIAPVRLDGSDHFCLSEMRLVPVPPPPHKKALHPVEYRTFPDTFARIVAKYGGGMSGPLSFEVHTKDGRVLEYGATPDSRALAAVDLVAAWHLSSESDRRGNAVDYVWSNDKDSADGHTREIVPGHIDYTRHGNTPASRSVAFGYDTTAPSTLYHAGLALARSKLLRTVQTKLEPDTPVRTYLLSYITSQGTQRNLLQKVEECAGAGAPCKPATTFSWSGNPAGFSKLVTLPLVPESFNKFHARWTMADLNGDGLEDIVAVHNVDQSTDHWIVALNDGTTFGPAEVWATLPHPVSAGAVPEDWSLTPMDYDQDGYTDLLIDSTNPTQASMPEYQWLRAVPNGPSGQKLELHGTGVPHPDGVPYDPPTTYHDGPDTDPLKPIHYRFARFGDVNGDGVADLIECTNPTYDDQGYHPTLGTPAWTLRLWVPSVPGAGTPGLDPTPIEIPFLDGVDCDAGINRVYVVDVDGDGASEIVVPASDAVFNAFRYQNGAWVNIHTQIERPPSWRLVHFLDLNGDGLSDAVYSGFAYNCPFSDPHFCDEPTGTVDGLPASVPFQALNDGKRFSLPAQDLSQAMVEPGYIQYAGSLISGGGGTDWWGDQAVPIDFDGDGRMDLLMPVGGQCQNDPDPNHACWVVLRTSPDVKGYFTHQQGQAAATSGFSTPIPTWIPLPFDDTGNPLAWYQPQVTDVNADGRQDLVVPNAAGDGTFVVYRNSGPQDLLTAIVDGTNPLQPNNPGFVPNVSIHYGSLVDTARTLGIPEQGAAAEQHVYLSHADPANGCAFPRACVVGADRVVSDFELNDGQNRTRTFSVRYRDARFHRLGRGFLGFGERIVRDLDAGSGTAERYDNVTWDPVLQTFPFAGQVVHTQAWSPASAAQPTPTQIELSYGQTTLQQVFTDGNGNVLSGGGLTYFTLPVAVRRDRDEGTFQDGLGQTLLQYVAASEAAPETPLGTTWAQVQAFDGFGDVLDQDLTVDGADAYDTLARTVASDTASWLIGLVQQETACSKAAGVEQCRVTSFGYTGYGEVSSATMGDPADPDTKLSTSYLRDEFGNVARTTADDGFGNHRYSCVSFEPDGIFPYAQRNTLGHAVLSGYDSGLGVMTSQVDPNGVATKWAHDGFGRITQEVRADGSSAAYDLSWAPGGGPQGKWWTLKTTTTEAGGATTTTELDGAGRPIHTWTYSSMAKTCGASQCTSGGAIEQRTEYDLLGRVTKRTVPWMVGDALSGVYADTWAYDAAGRTTQHKEPWGRLTTFSYGANHTYATDWLGTSWTAADALGRTTETSDRNGGKTETAYGPFGFPRTVTRFGTEVTETDRDAYGRVRKEIDPDRGETDTAYDGFGEPRTMDDAAGRHFAFERDGIGRLVQRDDTVQGVVSTTTWTYDTATHGVGRIASVTSPAGHADTYTYDALSRPSTHTLKLGDTGESFASSLDYDTLGRVWHVTYPAPQGTAPLIVRREYDGYGDLVALHDDAAGTTFWQLQQLDGAGRTTSELLGNGVVVSHAYKPASGMVEHIGAKRKAKMLPGPPVLQDLTYAYDLGLRMTSRSDALQPGALGPATEIFQHDALDRLTCASFFSGLYLPGQAPPCDHPVTYKPNGNVDTKDGVGTYAYDTSHPHAVTLTAGPGGISSYGYDAVGNQTSRPGAPVIAYTPFDLPSAYTLADDSTVALDYDGDQHRIRKTAELQETVYLDEIYERATEIATGIQTHRYYVVAGSATVVVTREQAATDEVAYLLAEALGSVDVVTADKGAVVQRRSYDAFGAKRFPLWGQSGSFTSLVTPVGFTGQEGDDELGLVNMRGRIYDPALARFLTADPLVPEADYAQSHNPYSYVLNSPLSFVDPSGFEGMPAGCDRSACGQNPDGTWFRWKKVTYPADNTGQVAPKVVWTKVDVKDSARNDAQPSQETPRYQERTAALPFALPDWLGGKFWKQSVRPYQDPGPGAPAGLLQLRQLNQGAALAVAQFSRDVAPGTAFDKLAGQVVDVIGAAGSAAGAAGRLAAAGAPTLAGASNVAGGSRLCFVAGTPVLTLAGEQAVEALRPGDRILSRDPAAAPSAWRAPEPMCSPGGGAAKADGALESGERAPELSDLVWVITVGSRSSAFARLGDLGGGERVAFQGKVYETRRDGDALQIRATGETIRRVIQTFRHRADRIATLTLRTAHGEHRIVGTPEHPFYVPARRVFVQMGMLTPGTVLLGDGDEPVEVGRVEVRAEKAEVFNVEVEGTHTYFVCGGLEGGCALVHNDCAAKAAAIIKGLVKRRPDLFKVLKCDKCANAMVKALKEAGISGKLLKVEAPSKYGAIVNDLLVKTGQEVISKNGTHYAVQVGDIVFDNLLPVGVPRTKWEGALEAIVKPTVTETPF